MSHAQQRINNMEQLKQQVCQLLHITPDEYAERQYKAGCQYLQSYIPNDPTGIDQLLRSGVYWAWWRNHWALRDETFCVGHVEALSMKLRHQLYNELHNPYTLATSIRPNGVVLQLAYASMIDDVHKQIHAA